MRKGRRAAGWTGATTAVLTGLLLALILVPAWRTTPILALEAPVLRILVPVRMAMMWVADAVTTPFRWQDRSQEAQRLRHELVRTRAENARLREAVAEQHRLTQLKALRLEVPVEMVPAAVVGRDPSNWYQGLLLNRGVEGGLVVDAGVIVSDGVVGTVIRVGARHAKVLLITDRRSAVAVINERTREEGIVEGTGGQLLRLKYLLATADVRPGDRLITSGLEGIFLKGLDVGAVRRAIRRPGELFYDVEVMPAVNLSRLEEVAVLRDAQ